jgi:hypothetical protein
MVPTVLGIVLDREDRHVRPELGMAEGLTMRPNARSLSARHAAGSGSFIGSRRMVLGKHMITSSNSAAPQTLSVHLG